MPWTCEQTDGGGLAVFEIEDHYDALNSYPTEAEALEYGIYCAEGWREAIQGSLTDMRRRLRALKRRRDPSGEVG